MYTINMSKVSIYRKKQIEEEKDKIFSMYKRGLSMREVAKIFDISHSWVGLIVKEKQDEIENRVFPNVSRKKESRTEKV